MLPPLDFGNEGGVAQGIVGLATRLNEMTVAVLQQHLRAWTLPVTGNKLELISRRRCLVSHDEAARARAAPLAMPAGAGGWLQQRLNVPPHC